MKKTKILAAALVALTMTVSAGAFAACNNGSDEHKCGHVCPTCQKCTSDCTDEVCKDKCEGHEPAPVTIDVTEGVYNNVLQQGREFIVKFYEGNVFYMGSWDTQYKGKYEIKNEDVKVANTANDGTIIDAAAAANNKGEQKWVTISKAVYFYEEDGTTPITVNGRAAAEGDLPSSTAGYAYGTPENVLAFDEANDQLLCARIGGFTRTLSHTTNRNFTVNDENAIEQAKFMVKTLPEDAEAGKVESDYFLTLSQKGYSANIPALKEKIDEGTYTKNGNVYSLTDTISGETATLTVAADGKSATVKYGSDTIELVVWQDKTITTPTGNVILEKDMRATIGEGENASEMDGKVTFYDSGAVTISVSAVKLSVTGSYKAESGKGLTVTGIGEMTLTQSALNLVVGGNATVGGKSAPISATITCTQQELGALVAAGAPTVTTVLEKDMTASIGDNELQGKVTFNSDGSVVISVPKAGLNVTGNYTAASGQGLTVTNIGDMTLTQSGLSLTLGGTASVGGKSAPISATITCTQQELGALVSAGTPEVTEKLAKDMTASVGGNELQGKITFKSDGTVVISVPKAGLNVTGNYTAVSGQGLSVTNIGEMTLTQSGLSLTLSGTASVGGKSAPISATITCTQQELMALMA